MIKRLFDKYKDVIPYAVFGVLTTLVNVVSYWFFNRIIGWSVMVCTGAAWFLAVLFAYVTNRKWVFHSTAGTGKEIAKEMVSFFVCRISTGLIDWLSMFVLVEKLGMNDLVIKVLANVFVILTNYVASKFLIFRKK